MLYTGWGNHSIFPILTVISNLNRCRLSESYSETPRPRIVVVFETRGFPCAGISIRQNLRRRCSAVPRQTLARDGPGDCLSAAGYRQRNAVERYFNKLKHVRAVTTRYYKGDDNFLASVKLAAFRFWMRTYELVIWLTSHKRNSQIGRTKLSKRASHAAL